MPAQYVAKSLRECSLRRIALSFETCWMKEFNEQYSDDPRLMYVIGPFDSLTNETVQSIIDSLIQEKCLRRNHLVVLLQESVVSLDLNKAAGSPANHDTVLQLIRWRCTKLVSLKLAGLRNMSPRGLSDLLGQLSGLKLLDLSFTSCNDQVLSVIGHSCPNLLHLLVNNTPITNSGIFSLCQACHTNRGCKKLIHLSITDTTVNVAGALHCLQNLPQLRYLDFNNICSVIEKDIAEREKKGEELHVYKLRQLHTDNFHSITERSIYLSCQWCLEAREVKFFSGMNNTNIQALKELKQLQKLTIGANDSDMLKFGPGILPVIEVIGHQLKELTLIDVSGVDVLLIGLYCDKLSKLHIILSDNINVTTHNEPHQYSLNHLQKSKLFQSLQDLSIVFPFEHTEYQSHAVSMLLHSATALKSITIQYMLSLTDEILLDAYKDNPLTALEKLHLDYCNNVGPQSIYPLLYNDNQLSELHLSNCWMVSRHDSDQFKKYARTNNFNLKIVWK